MWRWIKTIIYYIIHAFLFLSFFMLCVQSDYIVVDTYKTEWQNNILPFFAELTFLYGFILLFLYTFFNKMNAFDCLMSYFCLIYITIRQYQTALGIMKAPIQKELWYTDPISINIKIFILLLIAIILIFMYILDDKNSEISLNSQSLLLILLCTLGILIFMTNNHLFILYLGVELQSLALYILCCLKRYSNKSLEAGLKYFLFGSFSSCLLLFGITLVYGVLATLNLNDIYIIISAVNFEGTKNILLHVGLICIMVGFMFKLALFPFHWWLADVYEGSADIITFFLAIVTKLPFFYIFYRLYWNIFSHFIIYTYILLICGVLSVIVGSILALYEIKLKKLFAYSSIVHMGYIVIALGLGSKLGVIISFYYFFIYIIITIYIFSIFLIVRLSNNSTFKNITDFVYLKNHNKLLALFAIVALLSLAGIPPLIGFYGKLFVFYLLIHNGNYYLCMFLVLLSILSSIYYIRLIRFIFFDDRKYEPMVFIKTQSPYLYMWIVFCFFLNIGFLFWQEPILVHIIWLFI